MKNLFIISTLALLAQGKINQDYETILTGSQTPSDQDIDNMFEQYLKEFSPKAEDLIRFSNAGLQNRKSIFADRVKKIAEFNSQPGNTYKKGLNAYSIMSYDEIRTYFNIVKDPQNCSATNNKKDDTLEKILRNENIPDYWDWREHGGVTPVKDQGQCGSCWTFSTVGCMEAHFQIKYQQFRNLSEQQLVDCAGAFDNFGCDGGLPSHAFEYIYANGGLTTEDKYPYKAVTQDCAYSAAEKSVGVNGGSVNITQGDEDELKEALYENGPISVAFEVVDDFMDYYEGVYTSSSCGNTPADVNHAVLAVGYGQDQVTKQDYWLVKNSWGWYWGDEGYFKIARGENMCGIAQCNSYPKEVFDATADAQRIQFLQN